MVLRPDDRGVRLLLVFFVFTAVGELIHVTPFTTNDILEPLLGPNGNVVFRNVQLVLCFYLWVAFLLHASGEETRSRRRWVVGRAVRGRDRHHLGVLVLDPVGAAHAAVHRHRLDRPHRPGTEAEARLVEETLALVARGDRIEPGPPGMIFAEPRGGTVEADAEALAQLASHLSGTVTRPSPTRSA